MRGGSPLELIARAADPTVDDLAEAVIAWSQATFGTAEIVGAQEQFFAEMGKIFPDDPFYDARMSYFFDWFLLERTAGGGTDTPLALLRRQLADKGLVMGAKAAAALEGLARFRHSAFEIARIDGSETAMVLVDLVAQEKIPVKARKGQESFRGLEKKAVFQGFVYRLEDTAHLSHGLVLHPARAASLVKKRLKIAKKSPDFSARAELCRLASLQLRYLRHRHVDPKAIYLAGLK